VKSSRRPRTATSATSEPSGDEPGERRFEIAVNGQLLAGLQPPDGTLLAFLRDQGFTGAKEACGRGECGACTVLVDGDLRLACITLSPTVTGAVTTVEQTDETGAVVREAFADHCAFQCGYCTPGHVMTAGAVIAAGPVGDREQLRRQISGNICRCTGYAQILDAIEEAAGRLQ
jgi:aerobic-type carbon monoxide dehydrogenase small subunit (CoxS/CutS family)